MNTNFLKTVVQPQTNGNVYPIYRGKYDALSKQLVYKQVRLYKKYDVDVIVYKKKNITWFDICSMKDGKVLKAYELKNVKQFIDDINNNVILDIIQPVNENMMKSDNDKNLDGNYVKKKLFNKNNFKIQQLQFHENSVEYYKYGYATAQVSHDSFDGITVELYYDSEGLDHLNKSVKYPSTENGIKDALRMFNTFINKINKEEGDIEHIALSNLEEKKINLLKKLIFEVIQEESDNQSDDLDRNLYAYLTGRILSKSKGYIDFNEDLTADDINDIVRILGKGARYENVSRLRSVLTYPTSKKGHADIYKRLVKDKHGWNYIAGQDYPSEIRQIRNLLIGK